MDVQRRFATSSVEDGVLCTSARVNGFELADLRFPPNYEQRPVDPELHYLAVVVEGALEKSFRLRTMPLAPDHAVTMPAGAWHGARFGPTGARVVVIKPANGTAPTGCFDSLSELRGQSLGWLARRLAGELHAADAAAPLAAEGLACELLAAASRETRHEPLPRRPPTWLSALEELLHARGTAHSSLTELADAVGVHPAHAARVFRARHGMSVGEYSRRRRLAWAARELAHTDASLAVIATQAGFADQSHFTRLFKVYVGLTPGRYRAETQRGRGPTLRAR